MTHVARALTAVALLAAVACKGRDAATPGTTNETGATGTAVAPDTAVSTALTVAGVMIGSPETFAGSTVVRYSDLIKTHSRDSAAKIGSRVLDPDKFVDDTTVH